MGKLKLIVISFVVAMYGFRHTTLLQAKEARPFLFDITVQTEDPTLSHRSLNKPEKKADILIVLYMAARNDLFPFAGRNIKQLQNIGSSDKVKIFIRFDLQKPGQPSVTKHFFIEKNKVMQLVRYEYGQWR